MNKLKFQLQSKLESPEIRKIHYSNKYKIFIVITEFDFNIYKYPSFELLYQSSHFIEHNQMRNIFELENGFFLLIYGDEYSKIEVTKFNQKENKLEIIQTIIEEKEYWHESYDEKVKKLQDVGEGCYHSYLNENTEILEFFNSNLIVLLTGSCGGCIWHNGDFEENYLKIIIFYKWDEKEKKYKSFIGKKFGTLEIAKFANSNILITIEDENEKDKFSFFHKEKKYLSMRQLDLNDEKNFFGFSNESNIIKFKEFENFYNIDLLYDKNNINERIFLGKKRNWEDYYFYSFNLESFEIDILSKINIDKPNVEKVLSFKNDCLISVITGYNHYFYYFEGIKGINVRLKEKLSLENYEDYEIIKKDEDYIFVKGENWIKVFQIFS